MNLMQKLFSYAVFLFTLLLASCATTKNPVNADISETSATAGSTAVSPAKKSDIDSPTITITFAGDIMAHTYNHNITKYDKIWRDVKSYIEDSDLAFANLESPVDQTKPVSSYPNFNLPLRYVEAAVDAGFDVFSLANNHSFDQGERGIAQTIISMEELQTKKAEEGKDIYFSGLKKLKHGDYTYNIIEKNGWKILFLPVTGILNYPHDYAFINYVKTGEKPHREFVEFCKKLRAENPCDLFVISLHADEPEYKRTVLKSQRDFYLQLLETADVVWANHAHIIKDREFIFEAESGRHKLIMYANGNTISGQRTQPTFDAGTPMSERDHTGDGLLYYVQFIKTKTGKTRYNTEGKPENPVQIKKAEPIFITTYINTAWEFVLKPLNQEFVDYLKEVKRKNWAAYIERRIKINTEATKDLIKWQ